MSGSSNGRHPALAALDAASLLLCGFLLVWGATRWNGVPPAEWWPLLTFALLVGVALADLGTGLVHWAGDSFGSERTPVLGPAVIAPFRQHHSDPVAIVRHGFLEVTGNNALLASPVVFLLGLLAPRADSIPVAAGIACGLGLAATGVFSNQLHRWAHMSHVPGWVAWLQRRGIILSRVEHSRHHCGDHDRGFCVANGWMNPVLDRFTSIRRTIPGRRA